jgi:glucose-6-phosphate isomerase
MDQLELDTSGTDFEAEEEIREEILEELEKLRRARETGYSDPRGCVNLPFDEEILEEVRELVEEKRELNPEYIVVAGIGGSNLGTVAIQEAVLGKLYNQKTSDTKILFAETTDSDHISDIIDIIGPELEKGNDVLMNGVSKSGGTTETIANFQVLVDLLKKHRDDYEKFVTVTTGEGSPLDEVAREEDFSRLHIPENVVGRYSVFSPVGLFPLGVVGVDIEELLEGARRGVERGLGENPGENPAARGAMEIFSAYQNGVDIHDTFLYGKDLESIGKWQRQLMAESLGKEKNLEDVKVNQGITPLVSVGSTDLHSMMQLYMGGPNDKLHNVIFPEKNHKNVEVPELEGFEHLVDNIQGRDLKEIMHAIFEGVNETFEDEEKPYTVTKIPDKSGESIGELLQVKMIETIIFGKLMNVNPFDQPSVEKYKDKTRKNLS